jgi:hypothetical protein
VDPTCLECGTSTERHGALYILTFCSVSA